MKLTELFHYLGNGYYILDKGQITEDDYNQLLSDHEKVTKALDFAKRHNIGELEDILK